MANGAGTWFGNKGAVIISFKILDKSFIIIGAHLAAFQNKQEKRL